MHPETFRAFHLHATHDFPKDNGLAMKIIKIIFAINAIADRKDFCPDSINNILNFTTLDEIKKNTFIEKCMLENGHTEYVPFFFGALKHSRCLSMYQYFTKEKQSDILHNIFKQTIESCDPEKVINFLYYNFQSRCRKPDGQEYDVYDEPACHLMKEVIKKDPENYIKRFIYKEQFGNVPKENKFMFNDFIFNIWCKDWKAFETDLMKMVEANNTPLMRELADFFNKFKAENYAPVCCDFKEGAYVYS